MQQALECRGDGFLGLELLEDSLAVFHLVLGHEPPVGRLPTPNPVKIGKFGESVGAGLNVRRMSH